MLQESDRAEHALLLEMAVAFGNANEYGQCVFRERKYVGCICTCLYVAHPDASHNPTSLFSTIEAKLPPRTHGVFCWPLSKAGAEERAAWCREEAKKLERVQL